MRTWKGTSKQTPQQHVLWWCAGGGSYPVRQGLELVDSLKLYAKIWGPMHMGKGKVLGFLHNLTRIWVYTG